MSEGLSITELSRLSNVSTKVISQTEKGARNPTPLIKNKIVKGLNANAAKSKEYEFKNVFPDDDPE